MIKNLRVCDNLNQLAAEPPYRLTFEYEEFEPKKLQAEIKNKNGEVVWQCSEDFKIPYVFAKTELTRLEDYFFGITLINEKGETDTAEAPFKVGLLGDFENSEYLGAAFSDTAPILHKRFEVSSTENAV